MSLIPKTVSYYLIFYTNRWVHLGTGLIKPKSVISVKYIFAGSLRKGQSVGIKKKVGAPPFLKCLKLLKT
ncbi:protein of unknown function [Shewanella benthica]|uniref:Uncharacterized protein n=1 Tax=Shewanella benthica TaxID=43661 RepID=A0A330LWF4_9GAMM|nr:protein of unknown function [Shewanella benthica]